MIAPRRSAPRPRGGAFTLVELLVVVSIIALLVSILLPSLSRAREIARSTVCGSNLNGLSRAFNMYVEEFGGLLPMGLVADIPKSEWYYALEQFSGSYVPFTWTQTQEGAHSIFRCPSSKATFVTLHNWTVPVVSYLMNQVVTPTVWPHIDLSADPSTIARQYQGRVNPDKIKKPSELLMLVDGPVGSWPGWYRIGGGYTGSPESVWGAGDHPTEDECMVKYWHGDRDQCNILFTDYHVAMGVTPAEGRDGYYQDPSARP